MNSLTPLPGFRAMRDLQKTKTVVPTSGGIRVPDKYTNGLSGVEAPAPAIESGSGGIRVPDKYTNGFANEIRQTYETNPDENALWRTLAQIIFQRIPPEQQEEQNA